MASMMIFNVLDIVVVMDGASFTESHKFYGLIMLLSTSGWLVSGVVAFLARKLIKWDTKAI